MFEVMARGATDESKEYELGISDTDKADTFQ